MFMCENKSFHEHYLFLFENDMFLFETDLFLFGNDMFSPDRRFAFGRKVFA